MMFCSTTTKLLLFSSCVMHSLCQISLPLQKQSVLVPANHNTVSTQGAAHDSYYHDVLFNNLTFYTIQLEVGTPPQTVHLLLDTGSSDTWFLSSTNETGLLKFNTNNSTSWKSSDEEFQIKYVKGRAIGKWGKEVVKIGGAVLEDQEIAVVESSADHLFGIAGLGPVNAESRSHLYDNIPASLLRQGHISKMVYSISLNDQDASSGNILFGALDRSKYTGPLYNLPLLSTSAFRTVLSSISLSNSTELVYLPIVALFDTGTSLTYLPQLHVEEIAKAFDAVYSDQHELHIVNKTTLEKHTNNSLVYSFMGANISVPVSDLFWPLKVIKGNQSDELMFMTILSTEKSMGFSILGDTFLRSCYVVYDLEYRQLAVAQAKRSTPEENTHFDNYLENDENEEDIVKIVSEIPGATSIFRKFLLEESKPQSEEDLMAVARRTFEESIQSEPKAYGMPIRPVIKYYPFT